MIIARLATPLLGAAVLALGACANFTAERVDLSGPPERLPRGLIVHDQVPLLVVENGHASIIMVQSPDRGTAIRFSSFLAKHDLTLEFATTGGLSKVVSNQDSTAFPLKLLDLAKPLTDKLPAAFGLSGAAAGASSSIQIYNIVFEGGKIAALEPLFFTPAEAAAGRCGLRRYRNMECVANFPPPRLTVDPAVAQMESIESINANPLEEAPAPTPAKPKPPKR
ncbi:MAG TPA: hypothetical protein VF650_12750 [Allosphingosinicella sp.]